jgi:hypothetical protein
MILLFISSCFYVPLPAHDLKSDKGVISEELIKSLKPGETTREDLLLLVGAPDTQYEQDRYFIYEWEATESLVGVAGVGGELLVIAHYFCVEFDENNLIKRFAHFKSDGLFKSKYDALVEKNKWIHESEK